MEWKIGANIAARRRAKGLTQEQLAGMLGVSPPAVSKWETDTSYPDITLLCPLARALGTDVDTLLHFEEELPVDQLTEQVSRIMETAHTEGVAAAYAMLQELLHRYPSSIPLNYHGAAVLASFELWFPSCTDAEKADWRRQRKVLLQSVYASGATGYWSLAVTELAMIAISDEALDTAEALLNELPERTSDATGAWMQLYLMRGEREKAVEVVQKRLYLLVSQLQLCLTLLLGQNIEPDPERALAIGGAYRQVEALFGCGSGMSDGIFVELYLRAGQPQKALECLCRLADTMSRPVQLPRELFFSKVARSNTRQAAFPNELRQMLIQQMQKEESLDGLRDSEAFQNALRKLQENV